MLTAVFGFGKRRHEKRAVILRVVYRAIQSFVLNRCVFYGWGCAKPNNPFGPRVYRRKRFNNFATTHNSRRTSEIVATTGTNTMRSLEDMCMTAPGKS